MPKSSVVSRLDAMSDSDEMFVSMLEMVFGVSEPLVSVLSEPVVFASHHVDGAFNPMAIAS